MSQTFHVETLPDIDQREIKRGRCPWCLKQLIEYQGVDYCRDCADKFVGKLTIED